MVQVYIEVPELLRIRIIIIWWSVGGSSRAGFIFLVHSIGGLGLQLWRL